VELQSSLAALKLEVDRARTADFLEVELVEMPKDESGLKRWKLTARVKPNAVSGKFPRENDPLNPAYHETGIYLRPAGATKARTTRIGVMGIGS